MLVALTGYGQAKDHQRAQEAGIDLHLLKPVGLVGLQEILASAAARMRAARVDG
ncbi:MAG: hypothetical protein WD847_18780 [Pirellulales bacterium]